MAAQNSSAIFAVEIVVFTHHMNKLDIKCSNRFQVLKPWRGHIEGLSETEAKPL